MGMMVFLQLTCEDKPISEQAMAKINNYYASIRPDDELKMHRFIRSFSRHTEPGDGEEVVNFISKKDLDEFLNDLQ